MSSLKTIIIFMRNHPISNMGLKNIQITNSEEHKRLRTTNYHVIHYTVIGFVQWLNYWLLGKFIVTIGYRDRYYYANRSWWLAPGP